MRCAGDHRHRHRARQGGSAQVCVRVVDVFGFEPSGDYGGCRMSTKDLKINWHWPQA